MILTGTEIRMQLVLGTIHIDPFIPENVGPNSYDVRLHDVLLTYDVPDDGLLDMKRVNKTTSRTIPPEGMILYPGILYLGSTVESAISHKFVPLLEGRSSIGRLGIKTHITAGFGDIGWGYDIVEERDGLVPREKITCKGARWTLEIEVAHPIKIYAGVKIAQVYFMRPEGKITYYRGKYTNQTDATASKLYEDFEKKGTPSE